MAGSRHTVNATEPLRGSRDRQVSFRFPLALDQRIDALLERATRAGERTTRSELIQALILSCELDGDALGKSLRTLRRALVGDALLDQPVPQDNVIQFVDHKPGPRSGRA